MHLSDRNRTVAIAFATCLSMPAPAGTPPLSSVVSQPPPYAAALQGVWDEGGESDVFCAPGRNLRKLVPSADGKKITWELERPVEFLSGTKVSSFSYRVLGATGASLLLSLEGEARQNPKGEPFVWELVVVAPGKMRWRSTHFDFGVYNNVWLVRCHR
jgi:hypothetical protein